MIGAFNYRGSGTGMGGRPDRSAQPAPGHDLEPVFVQVYVTDGPKQFLAHLAYCAFTNADTDQRANSMAMMDGPPPPQLLAETRWEDPPHPAACPLHTGQRPIVSDVRRRIWVGGKKEPWFQQVEVF